MAARTIMYWAVLIRVTGEISSALQSQPVTVKSGCYKR